MSVKGRGPQGATEPPPPQVRYARLHRVVFRNPANSPKRRGERFSAQPARDLHFDLPVRRLSAPRRSPVRLALHQQPLKPIDIAGLLQGTRLPLVVLNARVRFGSSRRLACKRQLLRCVEDLRARSRRGEQRSEPIEHAVGSLDLRCLLDRVVLGGDRHRQRVVLQANLLARLEIASHEQHPRRLLGGAGLFEKRDCASEVAAKLSLLRLVRPSPSPGQSAKQAHSP